MIHYMKKYFSISSNQIINTKSILSENNFVIMINELVLLLENIELDRKKQEILNSEAC